MDSIEFIGKYPDYIRLIKSVTKEKYYPILDRMENLEIHDVVTPDTWFQDESSSIGFVYRLFIKEVRKMDKMS